MPLYKSDVLPIGRIIRLCLETDAFPKLWPTDISELDDTSLDDFDYKSEIS